jgi:hypothetical protein
LRGVILGLLAGFYDVLIQPFATDGAVVTLDIDVLLRLSGLDMLDDNPMLLNPNQQLATDLFRAVACWERRGVDGYGRLGGLQNCQQAAITGFWVSMMVLRTTPQR